MSDQSHEQWQLHIARALVDTARLHAPHKWLPDSALLQRPPTAAVAAPAQRAVDDAPTPTDSSRLAGRRRTRTTAATAAAPLPSDTAAAPSAVVSPVAANVRIQSSSYAPRPHSAVARRLPSLEPTFSAVPPGASVASAASRFPTLVQMQQPPSAADAPNVCAPLPDTAASTPGVVASSTTVDPSPLLPPWAPANASAPSTMQRHYSPPAASVRDLAAAALQALIEVLQEHAAKPVAGASSRDLPLLQSSVGASSSIQRALATSALQVQFDEPVEGDATVVATIDTQRQSSNEISSTELCAGATAAPAPASVPLVGPSPPAGVPPVSRPSTALSSLSSAGSLARAPLAARPAFVVSTSSPHAPLSLGVTGSLAAPAPVAAVGAKESYQARIARESEARRVAKAEAAALQAREDAERAARRREQEQAKREATKALLAVQKREKEERERVRLEEEQRAARLAKKAASDAMAKRKAEREEAAERARKAKEEEQSAPAPAAAPPSAADAATNKRASAQTAEKEDSAASVVSSAAAAAAATSGTAAVLPSPSPPAPTSQLSGAPAAASLTPAAAPSALTHGSSKVKAAKRRAAVVDFGVQTDPCSEFDPAAALAKWVSNRYESSEADRAEEALEAAELAALSLKDQVAKLQLDARYNKLRIRGLDEEAASSLAKMKQLKEELAKQRWIIQEQAAELKEWRAEGAKMVSTGIQPASNSNTKGASAGGGSAAAAAAAAADPQQIKSSVAPADGVSSSTSSSTAAVAAAAPVVLPFDSPSSVSASVFALPPAGALDPSDPASLAWLRSVFEQLQSLDKRRRDAERVTADTIHKGRLAELNMLEMYHENQRLQTQLDVFQRTR